MADVLHVGAVTPLNIVGSGRAAKVTNTMSTGTLYIGGPAVSSSSNTYSIAAGAQRTVFGPAWAVGSVKIILTTDDLPVGVSNPNAETRFWIGGISPVKEASGAGTSTTPTANTAYIGPLWIPSRTTLTGIAYEIGGTGGTDKAIVALYDRTGKVMASSAIAGVTVGTANTFQSLPFTAPLDVLTPGRYFAGVMFNGNTARVQVQDGSAGLAGATSVLGGTQASATDFTAAPVNVTVPSAVGAFPVGFSY